MTVKQPSGGSGSDAPPPAPLNPTALDTGILVGVLIGEGHFGGDGRQAQITLRMHTRHASLFHWIVDHFGGRLYGPYNHGGREYYQWMCRGQALATLLPVLDPHITAELDAHAADRYARMKAEYGL